MDRWVNRRREDGRINGKRLGLTNERLALNTMKNLDFNKAHFFDKIQFSNSPLFL